VACCKEIPSVAADLAKCAGDDGNPSYDEITEIAALSNHDQVTKMCSNINL